VEPKVVALAAVALRAAGALALAALLGLAADGPARADHGTPHTVDQLSIDLETTGNGVPATGDRDGDILADAEGALDGSGSAAGQGVCGNGIDDDPADTDFDGTPDTFDGVPDDGCVVPLSARETCANIVVNGILDADEDEVDRLLLDVTMGQQPGPGGGFPPEAHMVAFQVDLTWTPDVLDVVGSSSEIRFFIHAAGVRPPFSNIMDSSPATSPYLRAVADGGPAETGAGVLARLRVAGNQAGVADLGLGTVVLVDRTSLDATVATLNGAHLAVSKDGPDAGATIGDSPGERFTCGPSDMDGDGVADANEAACGSDADSSAKRPERLDGAFAGVSDDGDAVVDEPLPESASALDCDGDGFPGTREAAVFGSTAGDQDACGGNGWPADLDPNNILDIGDFNSFLFPLGIDDGHGTYALFGHTVPDAGRPGIERWNISNPPDGVIDIGDINPMNPGVMAGSARPPMLGGAPAFGQTCPWPP